MHIFLILLSFSLPSSLFAADLCDIIKIPNCPTVTRQLRRTTFSTAPTQTTASFLNPSSVTFDKGVGVEANLQPKNSVVLGLTSGTGKMGGALISGTLDNSFFGNRIPELNEGFLERNQNDQQYHNKKISVALGARLYSGRKVGLDIGVIAKRHPMIKKVNLGGGLSGRLWIFNFGASVFKDDMYIDLTNAVNSQTGIPYSTTYNATSIQESFTVTNLTGGVKLGSLSFDVGSINSKLNYYAEPTRILIYSGAYHYKNFLFNLALRREHSSAPEYVKNTLDSAAIEKSETYGGVQYAWGKHLITGVHYNYFLLKEISFTVALFI